MPIKKTGGGRFDPSERPIYFLANKPQMFPFTMNVAPCQLIAVNELNQEADWRHLEELLAPPETRVLLDSGIFVLAMDHARAHDLRHDQALNLAPEEVDGFPALYERYVTAVRRYEDRLWGYVELDLGGAANKRITRGKLEALGLRPIPVYHPFGDGWDYFDELAASYDRICLGNIVQAKAATRLRLMYTAYERARAYPGLWIHGLGATANELVNAVPLGSVDSSAWLGAVRWAGMRERSAGASIGELPRHFQYTLKDAEQWQKGIHIAAYDGWALGENWRALLADRAAYSTDGSV